MQSHSGQGVGSLLLEDAAGALAAASGEIERQETRARVQQAEQAQVQEKSCAVM